MFQANAHTRPVSPLGRYLGQGDLSPLIGHTPVLTPIGYPDYDNYESAETELLHRIPSE